MHLVASQVQLFLEVTGQKPVWCRTTLGGSWNLSWMQNNFERKFRYASALTTPTTRTSTTTTDCRRWLLPRAKKEWLSFTNPSSPRQSKATECYCAYATRGSHIKASSPHLPAIQFWRLSWLKTNSQNPILWKKNKLKNYPCLIFKVLEPPNFRSILGGSWCESSITKLTFIDENCWVYDPFKGFTKN